ncbi:4'-phosphopantetheinyl transferase family protein [Fodinicola acaciae]|uniref:4'-phosphopantetheinyl transferase family protein n=1 Tax=Fodinicola acaciae TaxID=2681555 RepID=UPI0013D35CB6|nr:4'-phosphopantetheinyl transferase superfamily protein [Fodinicola acaciae]
MTNRGTEIWWASATDAADRLLTLLPAAERDRHRAFVRQSDRDLYLTAHALTRLLVGDRLGVAPDQIVFDRTCHCGADHGKPRLPGTGLETSLSHSGKRVAVALAPEPVGVDVERVDRSIDIGSLSSVALSEAEQRVLDALPADRRPQAFFTYWCRKEALLKATGDGLSAGLHSLTVSSPATKPELLTWSMTDRPAPTVSFADLQPDALHLGCVAVITGTPVEITEHDGSALLKSR